MSTATNWAELVAEAGRDRRREKRVPLTFPIEVCGFDRIGHFFAERTVTVDVSANGCSFKLRAEPESKTVVAIKLLHRRNQEAHPDRPLLFQIVWAKQEGEGWVAGAAKLQDDSIWCVAFAEVKEQNLANSIVDPKAERRSVI